MSMPEPRVEMPVALAVLLGWLVPGLGHYFVAERMRGVCICLGVWGLFVVGLLIGGIRIVEAPRIDRQRVVGSAVSSLTFNQQVLAGPIAFGAAWLSNVAAQHPETAGIRSHARVREIGTLYTTIAGLLNVLAMMDAAGRAGVKKKGPAEATAAEGTAADVPMAERTEQKIEGGSTGGGA